jgi:hypothetical protein
MTTRKSIYTPSHHRWATGGKLARSLPLLNGGGDGGAHPHQSGWSSVDPNAIAYSLAPFEADAVQPSMYRLRSCFGAGELTTRSDRLATLYPLRM